MTAIQPYIRRPSVASAETPQTRRYATINGLRLRLPLNDGKTLETAFTELVAAYLRNGWQVQSSAPDFVRLYRFVPCEMVELRLVTEPVKGVVTP